MAAAGWHAVETDFDRPVVYAADAGMLAARKAAAQRQRRMIMNNDGNEFKFEPWANLAALGRRYEAPVYAGMASRRLMGGGEPENASEIEVWRGEALAAWKAGVDGIYTFNRNGDSA